MWDFSRKIDVPASNETKEQVVAGTWLVRWMEIKDSSIGDRYPGVGLGVPQVEVFAVKSEAEAFVDALKKAYTLTRCAGHRWIELQRQK